MTKIVSGWLESLGLGQYADAFADNAIDWDLLPDLDRETLRAIGVTVVGHQMRILKAAIALESNTKLDRAEEDQGRSDPTISTEFANAESQAERRQLTVMFCDLVGSTELSQRLDPEDLRGVIRAYQNVCKAAIERYNGYVAKYMGDGVLAYFGYPLAHEDDAERAIRASLDLIEPVSNIEILDGTVPQVRVGIATGPVVVGDLIGSGASLENAVVGETPNIAARLQGLADPNSIVVAPSTHKLSSGHFQYQDLGLQSLKGIEQPVRVWKVQDEAKPESRFEARKIRQLTPLIGREEELGILRNRRDQTYRGEGQVVLISGEPGIGKSRLCESLMSELSEKIHFLCRYQCSPHHMSSALHPIIHQIEQTTSIERSDSSGDKLDKLEGFLNASRNWDQKDTPLIAMLLSIPHTGRFTPLFLEQQEQKERTIRALVRYIEGLSTERTVVILFEDLHWVDPSTLELLDMLIERTQHLPVLMLITFRPEFTSAWVGQAHVTLVALNRINKRESLAMLSEIAPSESLSGDIVDDIMTKTDGVPLFIEEVTRTVLEFAAREEDSSKLSSIDIPSTLQDSLVARLDRLVIGKQIAQIAAAIGREFSEEMIASLCDLSNSDLNTALDELVITGLLFQHGSGHTTRYVFKHALLQDAAYNSLLLETRKTLHRRIAETLIEMSPDDFSLLAHHWERAGVFKKALRNWQNAAERAIKLFDKSEAIAQYWRALDLIDQQPLNKETNDLHLVTLVAAVDDLVLWRNVSEQEKIYRHLEKAIHFALDTGDLANAAKLELHLGDHTRDEKLLDRALVHAESSGDQEAMAYIFSRYSHYLGVYGKYDDSHVYIEKAINIYSKLGQSVRQAGAMIIEGRCYSARAGRLDEALQYTDRARKIAEIHDDIWLKSHMVMECEPCVYKGMWERTILIAEQELYISQEIGEWGVVLLTSAWAAIACMKQGRLGEAQRFIDEALACTEQRPNLEFHYSNMYIVVSQLQIARADTEKAIATVRRAVEIADRGGFLLEHGAAHRVLGQVLEVMGNRSEADGAFRQSLDILSDIQSRPELAQSLLAYGRFKRNDDADEGKRLLTDALSLFRETNATGWIEETLDTLG